MEEEIRRCAAYVVGRNCYLAGFAIILLSVTQIDQPALALGTAALLNFVMTAALLLSAINASSRDYRRSQIWALLKQGGRLPPAPQAQQLIGTAKRDICALFARYAGAAGAVFLAMGLLWAGIDRSAQAAGTQAMPSLQSAVNAPITSWLQ